MENEIKDVSDLGLLDIDRISRLEKETFDLYGENFTGESILIKQFEGYSTNHMFQMNVGARIDGLRNKLSRIADRYHKIYQDSNVESTKEYATTMEEATRARIKLFEDSVLGI